MKRVSWRTILALPIIVAVALLAAFAYVIMKVAENKEDTQNC